METPDKHLDILLDIQKQIGDVKAETTGQSQMLVSLNEKVAIQNARVVKLEIKVSEHQSILDNWKGKLTVLMAIVVFVIGFIRDIIFNWVKGL